MKYDIIVVGSGSSAFTFLKGLEENIAFKNKKIAIISPSFYKGDTKEVDVQDISPKFFQRENLLSLSYYLDTVKTCKNNNFKNIGVHGIGGMCRIWGGSLGLFGKSALEKNGLNYEEFQSTTKDIEKFLPCRGNESDYLKDDFYISSSSSVKTSSRIDALHGKYLNGDLKIGYPRLLVKDNCNNCNDCLSGCELQSVWHPLEEDFNSLDLDLDLIKDTIVTKIFNDKLICLDNDNNEIEFVSKKIVLASGVMQNYNLLSSLDSISNSVADLYSTPAVTFAFFNFKKLLDKSFFGMGNASFNLIKNNESILYGNLYDGYSLSVSKTKVFSKNYLIDKVYKVLSKFMIAGAGFMPSDFIKSTLNKKNGTISIKSTYNDNYNNDTNYIKDSLKQFVSESNGIFAYYKKVLPGADIHYAGGIPDDLYDSELIKDGKLKNLNNIIVVGGSTFRYLSPMSPTFSYMVNSYRIGKNFKN